MPVFRRLLTLGAPFTGWMLLAALLGILTIASGISLMALGAWIIATAALRPPISALSLAIVGVRFFGIARGGFRYLERLVSHEVTFRLLARLRVWFYEGLEPLAPARLMQHRSGDLLARIVADIDTLENIYLRVIAPPLIALVIAVGVAVFFALHDPILALALLACLLLAGAGVPLLTNALARRTGAEGIGTRAALNVALVDGVQGMADLVAYGAAQRHADDIQALNRQVAQQQALLGRVGGLQNALMSFLAGLAALLVLAIGTPQVRAGDLDGVLLAVLVLVALSSFEAVLPLPAAFQNLGSSLAAARRLFDIVEAQAAVRDAPGGGGAAELRQPAPPLTVRDVSFRYHADEPPALHDISFTLPKGATVAIVGASGAGKSSLVNLLLRFWEADDGQVLLFGQDVRELAADAVRAQISVVSQQTYLFNTTIAENLRIARPAAPDVSLVEAARAAHLHDFVTGLPDGYGTQVGEQGLSLSGGERQRVAIARAILKDAPLLILDEPTANLDAVTERAVLATIYSALPARTTLLITHRLVGLDRADEVLVLHAGRLVERGTHPDLLQAGGVYYRMWSHQQQQLADDPIFDIDSTQR